MSTINNSTAAENDQNLLDVIRTSSPVKKTIPSLPSLKELRLSNDYKTLAPTEDLPDVPQLKVPHSESYIRVHPDWQFCASVIRRTEGMNKTYHLVTPAVAAETADDTRPYVVVPYVDLRQTLAFWPLRLPTSTKDFWASGDLEISERAKGSWLRIVAGDGRHKARLRKPPLPQDPDWTQYDMDALFLAAIREDLINSMDHQVVVDLGEAA